MYPLLLLYARWIASDVIIDNGTVCNKIVYQAPMKYTFEI